MQDKLTEQQEQIRESGELILDENKEKHKIFLLNIIGEIEGHECLASNLKTTKYEHVLPQLAQIEDSCEVDGLLILIHTVGGDVEAGLAIAELIAGMKKPTVSLVLGGGHSIGVPLAVAAKYSFIAKSASMTVHPVRMNGLLLGVPQTFTYFQRMQTRITQFVTENSHITPERFHTLAMNTEELVMDIGTVLDGQKAVDEGLIDAVGSLSDALDKLNRMIGSEQKPKRSKGKGKQSKKSEEK